MLVRGQEAVDLGEMHPTQQLGIVRRIRSTVGRDTPHTLVHRAHAATRRLRLIGRAVGGGGEEVGGALEPTPGIVAVVGVRRDTCHGERMQALEQQGAQATDEHRGITVHAPDRSISREPPWARRREQLDGALATTGTGDAGSNDRGESSAHVVGRRVRHERAGRKPHAVNAIGDTAHVCRTPAVAAHTPTEPRSKEHPCPFKAPTPTASTISAAR